MNLSEIPEDILETHKLVYNGCKPVNAMIQQTIRYPHIIVPHFLLPWMIEIDKTHIEDNWFDDGPTVYIEGGKIVQNSRKMWKCYKCPLIRAAYYYPQMRPYQDRIFDIMFVFYSDMTIYGNRIYVTEAIKLKQWHAAIRLLNHGFCANITNNIDPHFLMKIHDYMEFDNSKCQEFIQTLVHKHPFYAANYYKLAVEKPEHMDNVIMWLNVISEDPKCIKRLQGCVKGNSKQYKRILELPNMRNQPRKRIKI